jgi:membrane-bound metal-dependent hydrolase YbcI (DUF457 family)
MKIETRNSRETRMDWITHRAAGVFVAWSAPRRWVVPNAVRAALAGALLLDVDLFIEPLLKPGSRLRPSRVYSLPPWSTVLAPIIALVPWWFNRKQSYAIFVALAGLGMLSHLVLDSHSVLDLADRNRSQNLVPLLGRQSSWIGSVTWISLFYW